MRPLVGSNPPRSVEALSTEVESTSPRVVVSVPRDGSETPTSRPPSGSDIPSVSARAEIDVVIPKLPPLAMAIVEQIAQDTEDLPKTTPLDADVSSPDDTSPSGALSVAEAAEITARADAEAAVQAEASEIKPAPEASATLAEVEAATATESPRAASAEAAANEPAPDTHRSVPQILATDPDPPTDPDDVSVPPIGDIAVERFFSQGDVSRFDTETEESLTQADKASRKSDPLVVQRRARFSRYVKWAVTAAAVVCVAAIGRTVVSSARPHAALASGSKEALVAESVAQPEPKAAPAALAAVAPPPQAAAEAPAAVEPAATEAEQPEALTGDAKAEKESARAALEKRKIADAIEAAGRSVKLDSSDGEAWLILGAAYQEKGNMLEARKAYASCVSEAKTGPKQECAKMLR